MPVLRSRLDPTSDDALANVERMRSLVEELRTRTAVVADRGAGGDDRSIARHRERGKIPVRARIDRLIDPGSAFLELSALAANGLYDDEAPSAGIVTGIGRIEGTTCVVVANDATVKGGTYYPMTVKKHLRAQ
jgi:3-methylcrotonyl-CoA carboxylase beta subunit